MIMLKSTLALFILNFTLQVSVVVQNAQVTPAPIRVISSAAETREIDLLSFDFQDLYYGFEGPNYTPMKGEPPAAAQLIAHAELFRPEAVSTARFEFVDAAGRELNRLFFTKSSADVLDGDFVGVVDVPSQPFKVRVGGVDITGKPYRRTYQHLFRPIKGRPPAPRLPPGMPADHAASLRRMLEDYDQQTRKKLVEEGRRNPDGTITLPRAEISEATYEPLMSNGGNVIGLRIRYAVRVSHDGHYAFSPSVWPIYADENSRGKIEMQAIAVDLDPLPEGLSAKGAALQLRYGGGATYRAGKTYRFTVDTIPNFAIQNAQRTRFCIMREGFKGSPELEAAWRSLVTSDRPVSYGTSIGWTTFRGRINSFSGPGVFYQSFLKEGAKECSAGGNINF